MRPHAIPCVFAALVAGCFLKTQHKPADFRGGYNDFQTQPNVHFVSFTGNGLTSRDEVIAGWHRRAAEICGGPSRYQIISQSAATTQHTATVGQTTATATTYGKTTYVTVNEPAKISFDKSRAEGYIRCNGATPDESRETVAAAVSGESGIEGSSLWCFAGETGDGVSTGICRATLDQCAAMVEKATSMGMLAGPTCARTQEITCFGATRDLEGDRVIACFPSAAICGRERTLADTAPGWSDVSACMAPAGIAPTTDSEAACDAGDVTACLAMARRLYDDGNYRRSLVFSSKACKAGDRASCVHAAEALESGEGIEPDPTKAAVLYKAACKLGDDAACESFARLRVSATDDAHASGSATIATEK